MHFNIVTIFPDLIRQALEFGVVGQALKKDIFSVHVIHLRDFATDNHKTVDDRPFGGGDGMILRVDILAKSMLSIPNPGHRVLLSATGKPWKDAEARSFAQKHDTITLVCGRYGGVDQRFVNEHIDAEISIGDYVVSGGELPALIMLDSIARQIPHVLGHAASAEQDSFFNGLLEGPSFTRPSDWEGASVPQVFLQGNHQKTAELRLALSVVSTALKRPDLLTQVHADLAKALQTLKQLSTEELKTCGLSPSQLDQLERR